jgi:hypothetical protein
VKAQANEQIQSRRQIQIQRCHRHPRGHLHAPLAPQQRFDLPEDELEAAAPILQWTQPIVLCGRPVQTHGHGETMLLEEVGIGRLEQGAVGGDGKTDANSAFRTPAARRIRSLRAVRRDSAVARHRERTGSPCRRFRTGQQQVDRLQRRRQRHVLGRTAASTAMSGAAYLPPLAATHSPLLQPSRR